jgi:HEAT repeat protein
MPLSQELVVALEADEAEQLDDVIEKRRPEDFDALRKLATGERVEQSYRTRALYALGRWADPSVVDAIVSLLPHLEEAERIAAVEALGRLSTQEALDAIRARSRDPSPRVRKFVVEALARSADPRSAGILREIAATDPEEWVRNVARRRIDGRHHQIRG